MKGLLRLASQADVALESPAAAAALSADEPLDWEAVYRRHAPDVARWATRLAGPTEDPEDLVHEVFMIVQDRLATFRGDAKLTTWLYRITVNVVRHQRRKNRLRRWLGRDAQMPEPADPRAGPHETVAARQALARVYRALDRLSERDRRVLILHELEGLKGAEIAELEGVTASAIWVRLHRARKRFEVAVAKEEGGR